MGAIYCVVGLAVLSMCLSLVKDEIIGKFIWLGEKLGLSKPDHYNTDDSEEFNTYREQTDVIRIQSTARVARYSNEAFELTPEFNHLNSKIKSA